MMNNGHVWVVKNPYGDTRTAPADTTFEQFHNANVRHCDDVQRVMGSIADSIYSQARAHDITKLTREQDFYKDFKAVLESKQDPGNELDFTKLDWYKGHVSMERHHLLSNCPDDVDLIDVIEMIADCVCAGLSRSGGIRGLELSDEILRKAVWNTVNNLKKSIEVEELDESKDNKTESFINSPF